MKYFQTLYFCVICGLLIVALKHAHIVSISNPNAQNVTSPPIKTANKTAEKAHNNAPHKSTTESAAFKSLTPSPSSKPFDLSTAINDAKIAMNQLGLDVPTNFSPEWKCLDDDPIGLNLHYKDSNGIIQTVRICFDGKTHEVTSVTGPNESTGRDPWLAVNLNDKIRKRLETETLQILKSRGLQPTPNYRVSLRRRTRILYLVIWEGDGQHTSWSAGVGFDTATMKPLRTPDGSPLVVMR